MWFLERLTKIPWPILKEAAQSMSSYFVSGKSLRSCSSYVKFPWANWQFKCFCHNQLIMISHPSMVFKKINISVPENHGRLVSNSMNNRRNGGSPKLKISIGIPSWDNPMTNLPKKNGWNSLQPPKMELKSLVPIKWPLLTNISGCSPGHIRQRI